MLRICQVPYVYGTWHSADAEFPGEYAPDDVQHMPYLRCFFSSSEACSRAERVSGIWLNAFSKPKS